jgi:golgin subfamily B member 1
VTPRSEHLIGRLREDPNDLEAYSALRNIFSQQNDFRSLSQLIENWALNARDKEESSRAFFESAEIVLHKLNDLDRTENLLRQAIHENPLNSDACELLISLLEGRMDFEKIVDFLDNLINVLKSINAYRSYVALLYFRLGEIWNKRLSQPERALQNYYQAIKFDASLKIAIYEAREICIAARDWKRSAALYMMEADAESDPDRKISLLSELAQLQSRELADVEGAIQSLRTILAIVPGDIQAMYELAVILVKRASTKGEEEARRDFERAAELFYQVAQRVDEDKALEFIQSALTYAPYHNGSLDLLEQLAKKKGCVDILPNYWIAYINSAEEGPLVDRRRIYLAKAYAGSEQYDDALFALEPAINHGNPQAEQLLKQIRDRGGAPGVAERPVEPLAPAEEEKRGAKIRPRDESRADKRVERALSEGSARPEQAIEPRRDDVSYPEEPIAESKGAPKGAPNQRITQLRNAVQKSMAARNHDEAAAYYREILNLDPSDSEAFAFLESFYRRKRDFAQLRDLLLIFARGSGLSPNVRKIRLREIAAISETKLRDMDGAIDAWAAIVALDPSDVEASKTLKRLLERTKNWDMLVQVLDREALSETNTDAKATLLARIAQIHYEKRNDVVEATDAYRQLFTLKPNDKKTRDFLGDLLLKAEHYEEAIPLLKERIADCVDDKQKMRLLHLLSDTLYNKVAAPDEAYSVCKRILQIAPTDKVALENMERIDQELGRFDRLLELYERRLESSSKSERHALLVEMGKIADEKLSDLKKSADYFKLALELIPRHLETLDLLIGVLERSEKFNEIIESLSEYAVMEKRPEDRVELFRRIARIYSERLNDAKDAADIWEDVLSITEDEEALRFMREFSTEVDDPEKLANTLGRLLPFEKEPEAKRQLLVDLADILDNRLNRSVEAVPYLKQIIDEIDPAFQPALDRLVSAYEKTGDNASLVSVLERRLAMERAGETRIALTKRLAGIYENELKDTPQAIRMLKQWVDLDTRDAEPLDRLQVLLEQTESWSDLVIVLDLLTGLETDDAKKKGLEIRTAEVLADKLGNVNEAWERLVPLVEDGDEVAEAALCKLAKAAGYEEALGGIYVRLAQQEKIPAEQAKRWSAAGRVYEEYLDNPNQALEAYLRMFATDLSDRSFLAQVERVAVKAKAWDRLARVYDRLLKQAKNNEEKVELLSRQADIIDKEEANPSDALDCIVRAFSLDPSNDALVQRAEELGVRANRSEDLLFVYERRRVQSKNPTEQVEFLIRSAKLTENAIKDRDRANIFLKKALETAVSSPELIDRIEETARGFDAATGVADNQAARRALVESYKDVAEMKNPESGPKLVQRASNLLINELKDPQGGFDLLRFGMTLFPNDKDIYIAIEKLAIEMARLDALDSHLSRMINEALDQKTAIALLERRGNLLEERLQRFPDAAEVYSKLLQLDREHDEASRRLQVCLKEAGRYQDLLLVIDRQLKRANDPQKLALQKEIAKIWEIELKNRWEALDAWKKVAKTDPDDEDAKRAIERLSKKPSVAEKDEGISPEEKLFDRKDDEGIAKTKDTAVRIERERRDDVIDDKKPIDESSAEVAADEKAKEKAPLEEAFSEQSKPETDSDIRATIPEEPPSALETESLQQPDENQTELPLDKGVGMQSEEKAFDEAVVSRDKENLSSVERPIEETEKKEDLNASAEAFESVDDIVEEIPLDGRPTSPPISGRHDSKSPTIPPLSLSPRPKSFPPPLPSKRRQDEVPTVPPRKKP